MMAMNISTSSIADEKQLIVNNLLEAVKQVSRISYHLILI